MVCIAAIPKKLKSRPRYLAHNMGTEVVCHLLHGPCRLVASLSSLSINKQKIHRSKCSTRPSSTLKLKSVDESNLESNEEEGVSEETFAPA